MTVLAARPHLRIVTDAPRRSDVGVALAEMDMFSVEHRMQRRFQFVRVLRGDRVIDFKLDLGPAADFPNGPLMIIGSTDPLSPDTVGELWDMAEEERGSDRLRLFLEEKTEQSTLIPRAIRQQEMLAEFKRRNPRTITSLKGGR